MVVNMNIHANPSLKPFSLSIGDRPYLFVEATQQWESVNYRGLHEDGQAVIVRDGQQWVVPVSDLRPTHPEKGNPMSDLNRDALLVQKELSVWTDSIRALVESLPSHGDTSEDCQRLGILNALSEVEKNINGLDPQDLATPRYRPEEKFSMEDFRVLARDLRSEMQESTDLDQALTYSASQKGPKLSP